MKYAPVVPHYALRAIPEGHDYHLVLSNQLLEHESMIQFYKDRAQRGQMVIMDNPVHERLEIPSFSMRCYLAIKVQPTCLIAPDVIGDPDKTYASYAYESSRFQYVPLMAAVQGKKWFDYVAAIVQLATKATYVAVPLIRKFDPIDRAEFIWAMTDIGLFQAHPNLLIHFLGAAKGFKDVFAIKHHPNVMGFDSAKPIYLALKGIRLEKAEDADWGRPDWFFTRDEPVSDREADLIRHNIEVMTSWLSV